MSYVYVKDSEGFVVKKQRAQIQADETIITAAEYKKLSGDEYYEKNFTRGGKRPGAGRKQKYAEPLKFQMRVSKQEKEFLFFARAHNFDYARAMK